MHVRSASAWKDGWGLSGLAATPASDRTSLPGLCHPRLPGSSHSPAARRVPPHPPSVSDAEPAAPPTHRARRELRGVVIHVRHHDDGCGCVREAVVQVPLHVCGLNDDRVLLNFLEGNEAGVGGSRTSVWDLVYRRSRFSSAQCAPGWGSRWRGRRPAGHSGGRWARPDPAAGGGATGASCADAGREAPGRVVTPAAAALTSAAHTWCRGRKEEDGARCRLGSGDEGQPARGGARHVCVGGLFL